MFLFDNGRFYPMSRGASARSALARRAIARKLIAVSAAFIVLIGCGGGGGGAPAANTGGDMTMMPGDDMTGGGDPLTFSATTGADTFTITTDLTGTPTDPLTNVIDGAGGTDEFQLNTGAVVRDITFSSNAPTGGRVHLQNIETITLNGGTVNGDIDASAATAGMTFNLISGRIAGVLDDITGSGQDDVFIVSGEITGNNPALDIRGDVEGGGGRDEVRLVSGGMVRDIRFNFGAAGDLTLRDIDVITIDGGTVNRDINAFFARAGVTFNLISGSVGRNVRGSNDDDMFNLDGGTVGGNVDGGAGNDTFIIGSGITISGMIDGRSGEDTLRLATGFTPDSVNLDNGVLTLTLTGGGSLSFALASIEDIDITGLIRGGDMMPGPGPGPGPSPTPLTFTATTGADTFAITTDLTGSPTLSLESVIDGLGGQDVLQLNAGAVVASVAFSNTPPTGGSGVVHLQNIETITINGGTVTGTIDASASTGTTGITFNLISGRIGGFRDAITGSGRDDVFIVSGDLTGNNPALDIRGDVQGGGGRDEVQLVSGGIARRIDFSGSGDIVLQDIEVITIDGGRVNGDIDAFFADAGVTFNLISGSVGSNVEGGGDNDTFIIGSGITISGRIDGRGGEDTLRLATGFTPTSANLFNNVLTLAFDGGSLTLTLFRIETINVGSLALTELDILTFPGTADADIFAITTDTNSPTRPLITIINGLEGADELQLNTGAVVTSISFNTAAPTGGAVHLQNVETITLDGGSVNGNITGPATATRFNLTRGTITDNVLGGGGVDTFVIGSGITIGGTIDGGGGSDTLSLASGFTPTLANLFGGVLTLGLAGGGGLSFSLASIETINVGSLDLTTLNILTFTVTTGADTFVIETNLTGGSPTQRLITVINGLGGTDELQINTGAVVASVSFNAAPPTGGGRCICKMLKPFG